MKAISILSVSGLALASPAIAQSTAASVEQQPDATAAGDIIVTAQRRAERLRDVPVAVTAFTAADIERRQIVDVVALTQQAPAITFTNTPYGTNDLLISIRGVAPGGVLPNVDQAVGTYVDGLYYARSQGSNFALIDLASAEILRGPQGTLFGRNTIGGALNITTAKPKYDLEGSVKVAYGNYDRLTGTGVLNLPVVDQKLAVRLVYSHIEHDGFGDNPALGPVADQNDDFVRASVRLNPAPTVRVDLSGDLYLGKNHQPNWILRSYQSGLSPTSLAPFVAPRHGRTNRAGINPLNDTTVYNLTGTITINLGAAELKSITGYRDVAFEGANDQDGTPLPNSDQSVDDFVSDQFSQELQLNGGAAGERLKWTTGLYFFREGVRNTIVIRSPAQRQFLEILPRNRSISGFAQLSYEIVPAVRLTAGARYVVDRRRITYHRAIYAIAAASQGLIDPPATAITLAACPYTAIGLNQGLGPTNCGFSPRQITFKSVPFAVGVDYKPNSDSLLYAKFSRGYRAGGFQQATAGTAAGFTPFDNEEVDSYEAGLKTSLFDRRLDISAAAYYSIYHDIQQSSVLPNQGTSTIITVVNAGRERIYGGEIEATALFGRLRLSGALGLVDPKFKQGPFVGTKVPTVAKTTWSISADYPIPIAGVGKIDLHVDYNYRSAVTSLNGGVVGASGALTRYSAFQLAAIRQDGYGLLAAQASITFNGLPVTFGVYGRNLTNRYYVGRTGSQVGSNYNSAFLGEPRTYGVSANYAF